MRYILYLVFCLPVLMDAQGYSYKLYTKKDGLADDVVSHICQDGKGYLWIRTDKGFSSFDGKTFKNYIDKSIDLDWDWDYDNVCALKNGGIVYLAGTGYRNLPDKSDDADVDSGLAYRKNGQEELDRRKNFVDKDGYRIFSYTKNLNNLVISDTVYYQYKGKLSFFLLPHKYNRNNYYTIRNKKKYGWKNNFPMNFLVRDFQNNVYLRGFDSIRVKNDFYLFDKGKTTKLFSADSISNEVKITKTHDNHYWLVNQLDENLLAECFESNGRKIKTIWQKSFFSKHNLYDYSKLIPDSKNHVWFSGPAGLVKISLNGLELFPDNKRYIPKASQFLIYSDGREEHLYKDDYSNFNKSFTIDKHDNLISGERKFNQTEFNFLCNQEEFLKNFLNSYHFTIRYCFIDNEQNIWMGLNSGLLKLSPSPFKSIDKIFSTKFLNHRLKFTDNKDRKYYLYPNFSLNTVELYIEEGDKTDKLEIKTAKANLEINFESCGNSAVLKYKDQKNQNVTLLFPSKQKHTCAVGESLRLILQKKDTLVYLVSNPSNLKSYLLTTSPSYFRTQVVSNAFSDLFDYSESRSFENLSKNGIYLYSKDLATFRMKEDQILDTINFIPKDFRKSPSCVFYERKTKNLFFINKNHEFLKIKNDKLEKLNLQNPDKLRELKNASLLSEKTNNPSDIEAIELEDLVLFRIKQCVFIFKAEGADLFFIRCLDFDNSDIIDYNLIFSLFADKKKLALYTEAGGAYVTSYEELLQNSRPKMIYYNTDCNLNGEIVQLQNGFTRIGNAISYLGSSGHNTLPPQLTDFEVVYKDAGVANARTIKKGEKITKEYNDDNVFIDYLAICLTDGPEVNYKYKLVGFEEDWNINKNSTLNYRNLPPGSYTFQVFASNNEGVWTDGSDFFLLEVLTPWYLKWWAYLLYILTVFGAFYLIMKSRTKQLVKEKEKLEQTVIERTKEVVEEKKIIEVQKSLIEEKHKEITDSINYAERIQRSFLATKELLDKNLKEYFVLFQPKEAVSGDFYWAGNLSNGNFALITADSTGHGVPGAIMSILNISCLENAIKDKLFEPRDILNHTRTNIIERLKNDGSKEGGKDGMDCSILSFDKKKAKITFSGANNPVWIVKRNELIELEPDKMPVGKHDKDSISFTQYELGLEAGDVIYTLTDGYPDQFGGPKGKKFMYKKLKDLLISIASRPMHEQEKVLKQTLTEWQGSAEQVDDITIIGVRV